MSGEASCDVIGGLRPAAGGHAGLLAEVCAALFQRYSELLIVAEFSVCLEPWVTSR